MVDNRVTLTLDSILSNSIATLEPHFGQAKKHHLFSRHNGRSEKCSYNWRKNIFTNVSTMMSTEWWRSRKHINMITFKKWPEASMKLLVMMIMFLWVTPRPTWCGEWKPYHPPPSQGWIQHFFFIFNGQLYFFSSNQMLGTTFFRLLRILANLQPSSNV